MKKKYVLDSNILIDDENCIEILRNGVENEIYIPKTVLEELDGLKKNPTKRHRVLKILDKLEEYKDYIHILDTIEYEQKPDNTIIKEISNNKLKKDFTFVTNDRICGFKADKENIKVETYKSSQVEEKLNTSGFIELYTKKGKIENFSKYPNTFHFNEVGKLMFYSGKRKKVEEVSENVDIWKMVPWDAYQRAWCQLLLDEDILITNACGNAGSGKSIFAAATALKLVFEQKKYKKIYITTSNVEASEDLGFRPGSVDEKFDPLIKHMKMIFIKLHRLRKAHKLFIDPDVPEMNLEFNSKYIEFVPLNFLRGETLENCIVIGEELQNISRFELKTLLSRSGENVKFISTGDIGQIDNHHLSKENNGIAWLNKYLIGDKHYGTIELKGKRARGPICSIVNEKFE